MKDVAGLNLTEKELWLVRDLVVSAAESINADKSGTVFVNTRLNLPDQIRLTSASRKLQDFNSKKKMSDL